MLTLAPPPRPRTRWSVAPATEAWLGSRRCRRSRRRQLLPHPRLPRRRAENCSRHSATCSRCSPSHSSLGPRPPRTAKADSSKHSGSHRTPCSTTQCRTSMTLFGRIQSDEVALRSQHLTCPSSRSRTAHGKRTTGRRSALPPISRIGSSSGHGRPDPKSVLKRRVATLPHPRILSRLPSFAARLSTSAWTMPTTRAAAGSTLPKRRLSESHV